MNSEKKIVIGKIGAPHGVRGEVRIVPLTDFPDRFNNLRTVFLDENQQLIVESVKYNKQFILLKFRDFSDRNAVEKLTGKLIKVDRSAVPPLAEGEYYSFDIVGLAVYDTDKNYLGKISEILKTGSNDVYVVESDSKQILLPALKKVVTAIDLAAGTMTVILPEEME